jgi:putative transposase
LDQAIVRIYEAHHRRVGSPKITAELQAAGLPTSRPRVARRMQHLGLRAQTRRRYRVTTDSQHGLPVAEHRLQRAFTQAQPNHVWVSDITYIGTREGWVYLCVFLDLYSRRIVGWACGASLEQDLVLQALRRTIGQRQPPAGLLIHSDQGTQYASVNFRALLHRQGFEQSMSRKGNCWDNAVAESFFKTLKTELVYHQTFHTRAQAYQQIFEYIEGYYNRQRRHQTLKYETPVAYEQRHKAA